MSIYNVHTPHKTFALPHKDGEGYAKMIDRIATKAGLSTEDATALKEGKDGAGLVYEFEGSRFALEDDDDLSILHSRLPPSSTPSATFHLTPAHARAHFTSANTTSIASPLAPPAYSTASSTIKNRVQGKSPIKGTSTSSRISPNKFTSKDYAGIAGMSGRELGSPANGTSGTTRNTASHAANGVQGSNSRLTVPAPHGKRVASASSDVAKYEVQVGKTADGMVVAKPKSVLSTRSRRSKWGDDDAEPMGEVHKRKWLDFHANNGVRTVTGKIGNMENIRMLLKSGYRQVYVSRSFAVKAGLVHGKYAMGAAGYTGLKALGNVPITVGSRTEYHPALINEEQHFDVVLGRTWLEKMNVKIDTLDPTHLTYMDSGESIPCDLVVLKDASGNVITIT